MDVVVSLLWFSVKSKQLTAHSLWKNCEKLQYSVQACAYLDRQTQATGDQLKFGELQREKVRLPHKTEQLDSACAYGEL